METRPTGSNSIAGRLKQIYGRLNIFNALRGFEPFREPLMLLLNQLHGDEEVTAEVVFRSLSESGDTYMMS